MNTQITENESLLTMHAKTCFNKAQNILDNYKLTKRKFTGFIDNTTFNILKDLCEYQNIDISNILVL